MAQASNHPLHDCMAVGGTSARVNDSDMKLVGFTWATGPAAMGVDCFDPGP